jgi:hypothetical protein
MKVALALVCVFLVSVQGWIVTEPVRTRQMDRIVDGETEDIVGGYEGKFAISLFKS